MPAPMQSPISAAAADLNVGPGDMLNQQRAQETEEQRRRRLMLQQMREAVNPLGSPSSLGLTRTPLGY